jgi:taurine dioxygenase
MASPQVAPLKAALGARIEGLEHADAARPEVAALLSKALGEHLLVVVPGERMTPAAMRDFASAFGKPRTQLLRYKRSGEVPEVSVLVSTLMADGTTDKTARRSEDWHTDDSFMAAPAKATAAQHRDSEQRGHDLVL